MFSRSRSRTSPSTASCSTIGPRSQVSSAPSTTPDGGTAPHLGCIAMPRRFPDGFTWGTATAAHQIEGGNWNNDWWAWEHTEGSGCEEPSGDACDSWHRWADDIALVRSIGFDNYRFSVEWSRIEPEEGEWSVAAVDQYRIRCEALLAA